MTSHSLNGKRVLVPRGKGNAKAFSEIVKEFEGIPVEVPLLSFHPIEKNEELIKIINTLSTYDWIIFTSNVTVETFFTFVKDQVILPKIAVIGEKTAHALSKLGVKVQFQPQEYVAESFVQEFMPHVTVGQKLLIPKGNLARDYIGSFFREKGLLVDEIVIYETIFPEESKEKLFKLLKNREVEILPFTSPSTIDHFMSVVNKYGFYEEIKGCIVACIGPVSKKRCEELGLKVHVVPKVYTTYDMIMGVADYINTHEKREETRK